MTSTTVDPAAQPGSPRAVVLDFAERAGWTAGQQFMAVLLTTTSATEMVGLDWKLATLASFGAALGSVLTTAILYVPIVAQRIKSSYWRDVVVRLVKTFLSSLLGSVIALSIDQDFDWSAALDLATITTIQALAKGLLARGSGDAEGGERPSTPSTLANETYERARRRRAGQY